MTPLISICIPTYEMAGSGVLFLEMALRSIYAQTFQDFEIIVSDHSIVPDIESLCQEWQDRMPVRYLKNTQQRGKSSANINHAIRHAQGKWIKPLFQDDLFYTTTALLELSQAVRLDAWVSCGCWHTDERTSQVSLMHLPSWNRKMAVGVNTIGAPSVVMFPNEGILFDEQLIWLMDCEFYMRLYRRYGKPIFVKTPQVLVRQWPQSVTETLASKSVREAELAYVRNALR